MTVSINGIDKQGLSVNGVQVKQTLSAASETVSKGVYDATTLSTVDAALATANIKNGITLFGFAGSADVLDVSDANAAVGDVKDPKTFYSVTGPRKTGTMPTRTLNAANENVLEGFYAATTLSAVDAQLAAANIKSGINIFGFIGPATVQEIGAANAVLADVKAGKTFFSVTGGIKTGNLATVALNPALNEYPAGYHVGQASLTAVDEHLATGNIKSGITIFGVAGHTNVRDSSDANAAVTDVKSPKTFYAGGGAKKTGTMATRTLNAANEDVLAGYYAATTLSAVDGDLAVGNIKKDVNIFGKVGTYEVVPTVTEVCSAQDVLSTFGTWFTICSGTVTADAKKVVMAADLVIAISDGNYYTKGTYNGVVRFSVTETTYKRNAFGKWSGDGVGSEASVILEGKSTGLQNQPACGVVWKVV